MLMNKLILLVSFLCFFSFPAHATWIASEWAGVRKITGVLHVTGVATIIGNADGGYTSYDLKIGDTDTPDYGMVQVGNMSFGRTSYKAGNIDLDGAVMFRNISGPVTSQIEFIFTESTGASTRFALPKSGVGNGTYNARSMIIAGPAPANTDMVTVGYWQTQGIFHNLVMDTTGDGADLGVQNDLEVEGDIFTDSIKESTTAAGITLAHNTIITGTLTVNGDQTGAIDHVFDQYNDIELLRKWRQGKELPFATGDVLNLHRLLRDAIIQLEVKVAILENLLWKQNMN